MESVFEPKLCIADSGGISQRRCFRVEDGQQGKINVQFNASGHAIVQSEVSRILPFPRIKSFLQKIMLVEEFEVEFPPVRGVGIIRIERKLGMTNRGYQQDAGK